MLELVSADRTLKFGPAIETVQVTCCPELLVVELGSFLELEVSFTGRKLVRLVPAFAID